MSLKLDELRKRLLQQPRPENGKGTPLAARTIVPALPPPEAFKSPEATPAKPTPAKLSDAATAKAPGRIHTDREQHEPAPNQEGVKSSGVTPAPLSTPSPRAVQGSTTKENLDQNQLGDAVRKVFDQTRPLQASFEDLTRSLSDIGKIAESAELALSPLKDFHGQLGQLAESFEPMRAFQTHLAEVGQTFEPMKVLHDQLAQIGESFQLHLDELVKALDPVKDFRDRIQELARSFDQASELQAELGELYQSLNSAGSAAPPPIANGLDKRIAAQN